MGFDISNLNLNLIIQGFIAAILIGMTYTIWATTRAYGGIVGRSLRLFGFGILFISLSVIEKMLLNFEVLTPTDATSLSQDILNLAGLAFLARGFSILLAASRT